MYLVPAQTFSELFEIKLSEKEKDFFPDLGLNSQRRASLASI
jgi:hypothetical protein